MLSRQQLEKRNQAMFIGSYVGSCNFAAKDLADPHKRFPDLDLAVDAGSSRCPDGSRDRNRPTPRWLLGDNGDRETYGNSRSWSPCRSSWQATSLKIGFDFAEVAPDQEIATLRRNVGHAFVQAVEVNPDRDRNRLISSRYGM